MSFHEEMYLDIVADCGNHSVLCSLNKFYGCLKMVRCQKFSITSYNSINYRIAGFVCEVLNCANYVSSCELAKFNSDYIRISNKFCFNQLHLFVV